MWQVGRIASGIICMIFVGWAVDSYHSGESYWEPIAAFVASFVGWAFTESKADAGAPAVPQIHPHDADLAMKLRGLLDERMKRYFREHSFGDTFLHDRLEPIRRLARWQGPECEFENSELDNLASEVVRLSAELDDKINEYGNPLEHHIDFWSLAPEHERISDYHSRETSQKIGEVNRLADKLASAGDSFEKAFRKLSPESYRSKMRNEDHAVTSSA